MNLPAWRSAMIGITQLLLRHGTRAEARKAIPNAVPTMMFRALTDRSRFIATAEASDVVSRSNPVFVKWSSASPLSASRERIEV